MMKSINICIGSLINRSTRVRGMTQLFWLVPSMEVEVLAIGLPKVQCYWYTFESISVHSILQLVFRPLCNGFTW